MKTLALNLTIIPDGWRLFHLRKADSAFLKFSEKIFSRDEHSCQFCGFKTHKHLEVLNLDKNYRNNKADNLATACGFCAQCAFLEAVGRSDYGGGTLIYLPEISQGQLNGFCHAVFESIAKDDHSADDAQSIYRTLKLRSKIIEKEIGEGTSNPAILGQMIAENSLPKGEDTTASLLEKIRLLPSREKFNQQIEDWIGEKDTVCSENS